MARELRWVLVEEVRMREGDGGFGRADGEGEGGGEETSGGGRDGWVDIH